MDAKNPNRSAGLQCSVTGAVIGKPLFKMVKNETVPMLGLTVLYDEYDGSTSICRVTLFGDQAQAMAGKIDRDQMIEVVGTGNVNSWEKNGEKKHGLAILARRIHLLDAGA